MRRLRLLPLVIATLLLIAVSPALVPAQEATPPAAMEVPQVVQDYVAAFEALDFDAVLATLSEDATYEAVPTATVHQGHAAIRAHLEEVLSALTEVTVTYTTVVATESWAAAEWTFSGRYTGQIPDFPPGEGQIFTLRGVDVLELEDGQIRAVREYADQLGFLIQLGAFAEDEGAGAPVATPAR
jgi:steroid delta-isomerase-like uncharacterized protein